MRGSHRAALRALRQLFRRDGVVAVSLSRARLGMPSLWYGHDTFSRRKLRSEVLGSASYCFRRRELISAENSRVPPAFQRDFAPVESHSCCHCEIESATGSSRSRGREVNKCACVRDTNRAWCQTLRSMSRRSGELLRTFALRNDHFAQ
jgi:hypothetical protein